MPIVNGVIRAYEDDTFEIRLKKQVEGKLVLVLDPSSAARRESLKAVEELEKGENGSSLITEPSGTRPVAH